MSEDRFVSGNVIVLYCNFVELESNGVLPQHIEDRIEVCGKIFERIMKSKPDRSDTIIKVSASDKIGNQVKNSLIAKGVEESKIIVESSYNNMEHLFSVLKNEIKKQPNPPAIYFVASYQQKDVFDLATANYKGYKIYFEGAFDKRPLEIIEAESKMEKRGKNFSNIKEKGKNKVVDMLLNYIFPDSKK